MARECEALPQSKDPMHLAVPRGEKAFTMHKLSRRRRCWSGQMREGHDSSRAVKSVEWISALAAEASSLNRSSELLEP